MNDAYKKLKDVWHSCSNNGCHTLLEIISILSNYNIRLRQKDGTLRQVTLSIPTTKENSYVIGLRYIKNDGTYTEDHYLCERDGAGLKGKKIVGHFKRKLEYKLPEYMGTHKEIPDKNIEQFHESVTDVSTYSYFVKR